MTWDRSRPWCVQRHEVNRRNVRVQFAGTRPTIEELAAIRKAFPELANLAPAALLSQLGDSGQLDLGERGGIEAQALKKAATRVGSATTLENKTRIEFSIIDESGPSAWLIEDEVELLRTVEEMVAAGVNVVRMTSD
jgi:hypothetical protein